MLARPERGEGAKDLCKHSPFVRLELTLLHASPGPDTSAWSSRIWACTTPKCPHLPLAPLSCLLAAPRNTHVHFHRRPLRDPGFQATLLLLPIWAHYIRETEAKWRLSPVVPLPAPPPSPLPSLPRCHEGQCLPPRRPSLTWSRPSCLHGKEKVKPRGRLCPLRPCFCWKSRMQSTMWSKS